MKNKFFLTMAVALATTISVSQAQDKLKNMPGYEQYQKMVPQYRSAVKPGSLNVTWAPDGQSFTYVENGKLQSFSVKTKKVTEAGEITRPERRAFNRPVRGRQFDSAESPDGKLKAFTKDRNMYLSNADGSNVVAITTDGNEENQVKYGIATWVYGEELSQNTAMWWSPDGSKIAFYRFVEKDVKKYYVLLNQLELYDSLEVEAYPKVGEPNLPVDLMVYDVATKKMTELDIRDGKPYSDGDLGTYIYDMSWTPDGKELLYHSTNRRQNILELRAANPETGKSRTVIREEWLPSFVENSPEMNVLADGKHFIWASERSGFNNYYLYNFDGTLVNVITSHPFEVSTIVKVDEDKKLLYYMARSGENHMLMQLHRVQLDGTKDTRLTDPAYLHSVTISPDGKFFVDIAQTHDIPPFTNLLDAKGKVVAELAKSDMSEFEELGLKKVEVFTFTSKDGVTELHGMIHFPSNFDPSKKYPVILNNYGGPATNAFRENFSTPDPMTEYGFLVLNIDGRNLKGGGKKLLDQLYGNLGLVEMDDFAEGIKSLHNRPYFDKDRVGVYGTSYGGTTAASMLLRFPELVHAAVANSSVTDWRLYDNIYTERFMSTLENNEEGYNNFSLMNKVDQLEGELLVFFGTADNNVHPANSLMLIKAFQDAGKSIEVQLAPDGGHTALNRDRMMEFFIEHLVTDYKKVVR
ncbi:dipeptidyl-peptidase-4 [Algoriphagus ratkowskyi]|uniref:Dipeptidyl-peptidase-4 n=1 Tax=Algoriphagus ratkowskyi TaxID=57028 RepID=A0A2W7R0D7_9BACT|nr:DPP IV N-terminal domain-containing protein [Algoriphagus ratkowskyi]PZX53984.1 dipeptidyl-peptidase-4 [Algoriphagus ratkowskyi]TXD76617.1 prolyl oligopeptidase family serine peptidase [Algoriphagus ratkowskyi]